MADDQLGQADKSQNQSQPSGDASNWDPAPDSQAQPIPPVENQNPPLEGTAPDMPNDVDTSAPQSAPAPDTLPSPAPQGGDYMDDVLSGNRPAGSPASGGEAPSTESITPPPTPTMASPQTNLSEKPPVPNLLPPQDRFAEPTQPSAEGPEQPERKKSNLWLPIVALVVVAAAAAVYFLFINKPSKTEEPTGTLIEESTSISPTTTQGSDTTKKEDLVNLQKALEQYYLKNQEYPISKTVTKTQDSNTPLSALIPDYLEKLPTDPSGSGAYYGYKSEDGKTYELSAVFSQAPTGVKSTQIAKGYLVTLTPGLTFETSQ